MTACYHGLSMKRRLRIPAGLRKLLHHRMVVIACALFAVLALYWLTYPRPVQHVTNAEAPYSQTFSYACAQYSDQGGILCLQKSYQQYTRQHGVAAAFRKLKAEYTTNGSVKAYCHALTHTIGRTAADMTNSVDTAYAQGDNFCWSGYYHGVMESIVSRIGKAQLASAMPTICAQIKATKPYSFYHYNCVHGLGHGVMDVTHSQLFESLRYCDLLTDNWEQQSCYGGVFMENEMDEVNSDHSTAYFKADQPMYPCTAVDDKYKGQCYLMQTSHALRVANEDFAVVFSECQAVEGAYVATCYQSLGRDASGNSNSSLQPTVTNCMLGPDLNAQQNCIIGAVKDFISYYHSDSQADELCKTLSVSLQAVCQQTKKDYYSTF